MKLPKLKTALFALLVLIVASYAVMAAAVALSENTALAPQALLAHPDVVAIFGASGTAGDGILKAALANPEIEKIHVITRRSTPRIESGIDSGKVEMTLHMDYLDYTAIYEKIAAVDAVFWAIGLSSVGVEEDLYRRIHIDFPQQFVEDWIRITSNPTATFHYISSSDISGDSGAMWARVKVEAEKTLFGMSEDTNIRVIAYRPDYIGPTDEESHLGQELLYGFFAPLGAAVRAQQIGQAMIEVTARGAEFSNGDKLGTRRIIRYSDAYEER